MGKTEIMALLKIINTETLSTDQKIDNLSMMLQEMLHMENAKQKGFTYKKQYQIAKKFLKGAGEKRSILKFVDYQEGSQVFTDTFVLFKMKNHIEGLSYYNDENGQYPEVLSFIPNKEELVEVTEKLTYAEVLNKCDLIKIDKVKTPHNKKHLVEINGAYLNPTYVKTVFEILGAGNNKIKVFYQDNLKPVLFANEIGDEAIIVPVKTK